MVTFTFSMRRHLIRLASAPFISSRLTTLYGWVRFPRATRGKHNAYEGWVRTLNPILSRLWTKVHEIFRRCRKPLVLSNALSDCLCHVSFRRYSPLSLEVVEKRSKCKSHVCSLLQATSFLVNKDEYIKVFWLLAPNFCGREGSDFSTAVC